MPVNTHPVVDRRFYAAVFLLGLSILTYEILLTRIFSVTLWYHFAFMAISISMFGLTLGAVLVYLFPRKFPLDQAKKSLGLSSLAFSIFIFVTFILMMKLHQFTTDFFKLIFFTYLLTSIPFIFAGIAVTIALTRFPNRINTIYAADLAGGSAGCIFLMYVIRSLGGVASVTFVAIVVSMSGFLFFDSQSSRLRRAAIVLFSVLSLFGLVQMINQHFQTPILRLTRTKVGVLGEPLYEKWNSFSMIRVTEDADVTKPSGWGISAKYLQLIAPPRELQLSIDASADTVLTNFNGDLRRLEHLKYDITNFAHHLQQDAKVLVIGMGGGRDVLSALTFGQRHISAIEINDQILEAVNQEFGDFTGHLDRQKSVFLVNDEARSYIARNHEQYDIIQVSLIDTWAATAAGAFALTEQSLYTVEAWRLFVSRLAENGILSFSRWYNSEQSSEVYRLASLARESLVTSGVPDPASHVTVVATVPDLNEQDQGIATLLLSKSKLSPRQIRLIRRLSGNLAFDVLYLPTGGTNAVIKRILDGKRRRVAGFDLSAPTDDRPFFFNTFTLPSFLRLLKKGPFQRYSSAPGILASLMQIVLLLTIVFLIGPLAIRFHSMPLREVSPYLLYFSAIGLGYMLVEIALIQRLAIFLGHPTYSLSVVLFTLLLATGLGSFFNQGKAVVPLLVLLGLIAIVGTQLDSVTQSYDGASMVFRILISILLIAPIGYCAGAAFPAGMRLAGRANLGEYLPWFWGINGAMSVCASVLGIILSVLFGISTSLWVGLASYGIAFSILLLVLKRH